MRYNLSEITALIKDRRTIYPEQFSTRSIQKEQIEMILNAAIWAPTHGNTQPWRFTVLMGESKNDLSEFLAKTYLEITPSEKQNDQKLAKMLNRPKLASAIIIVSMNRDENQKIKEIEEIEAVACAIQNMHLTCTAYGIGGFWSTPSPVYTSQMNNYLGLNLEDKCLGIFYLGYPSIDWPKAHRKPIEYVTEWKI
jgi:nitroreductase